MQLAGRRALRNGLESFDRRRGYRGAIGKFEGFSDWKKRLAEFKSPPDIAPWRVALVRSVKDSSAVLSFADEAATRSEEASDSEGLLTLAGMKWAARALENDRITHPPKAVGEVVKAGDIILVEAETGKNAKTKDGTQTYGLRQIPIVNGGLIAMDPHTGRILALVGGYSFNQNQYNRVTQAKRQPGSSFKPFVYAAALENGFTPSSQVLDAPFVIARNDADNCDEAELLAQEASGLRGQKLDSEVEECERFYKPSNYSAGKWYGLSTLRLGLEKSRNAMTVRLASDIGMAPVMKLGERVGIYDKVQPELAWSLGAGETTLMRLAEGYSVLVNGGKGVTPRIIDRVQNGQGETIYLQGEEACEVCAQDEWTGQSVPDLPDTRAQAMDPITAYQVTYMLKGVVDNGTGRSIKVLGRPLGGKTGTTNDYKDAWFMGFSPDLVTGVYVGYDTPRGLANEAGGRVAAPIFRDFMGEVLKDEPIVPFRIPEGITLAPVNRDTGEPSFIGAPNYILEAYRTGTEPRLGEFGSTISVGGGYSFSNDSDAGGDDTDFYSLDYESGDGAYDTGDVLESDVTGVDGAQEGPSEAANEKAPKDVKKTRKNKLKETLKKVENTVDTETADISDDASGGLDNLLDGIELDLNKKASDVDAPPAENVVPDVPALETPEIKVPDVPEVVQDEESFEDGLY